MNRLLAVGDIHNGYIQLKELVEDIIVFDPSTDKLIFLGDANDRGADAVKTVEYLTVLKHEHPDNIVLLYGNHELLAQDAFLKGRNSYAALEWLFVGGDATLKSYGSWEKAKEALTPFFELLKPYHVENGYSYTFVHGGIPAGKTIETAKLSELVWTRPMNYRGDKIVVGHSIELDGIPKWRGDALFVDTGCFLTGVLSAVDMKTMKIYQTIGKPKIKRRRDDQYLLRI